MTIGKIMNNGDDMKMTTIPNINELKRKSDEVTVRAETAKLKRAIAFVSEKLNNLTKDQLQNRKIGFPCSDREDILYGLKEETKANLVGVFEKAGYEAKWRDEMIGSQFDYDTVEYFDISWKN